MLILVKQLIKEVSLGQLVIKTRKTRSLFNILNTNLDITLGREDQRLK